jgi:hypothetical protein
MAAGMTDHVWTVGELLSLPLVYEEVVVSPMIAG